MADDLDVGSVESALEGAFSSTPAAPKVAPVAPAPTAEVDELEAVSRAAEGLDPIAADTAEPEPVGEIELEIDMDGAPEVIRGNERVKDLVQKGLKAGRLIQENAHVRDALAAHVQQIQAQTQFQQAVMGDISQLQAIDAQLNQFNQIDWNTAFDSDAFNALKMKEQRDQLREMRNGLVNQLNYKQQQFAAFQTEGSQRVLAAESKALLAKLPEWQNPEKAQTEQKAITTYLQNAGFNAGEIQGLTDHRAVIVARKAYLYDQLMSNRATTVKKVSAAPTLSRPGVANAQPNGRNEFTKARTKLREFGTKGNHGAQEKLATAMFEKAFNK